MPSGNVVLIGFMGTGKSTVGRELGALLQHPILETDELVERLAGQTIPEIFAGGGESRFRQLETRALRLLQGINNTIIITGGGTPADPANRRRLARLGPVVCLTAETDVLEHRTTCAAGGRLRPLLAGLTGEALRSRLAGLLTARAEAYEWAGLTVATSQATPADIARTVRDWLDQSYLHPVELTDRPTRDCDGEGDTPRKLAPDLGYSVIAGTGALDDWPRHAGVSTNVGCPGRPEPGRRVLLVTEPLAGGLWGDRVLRAGARAGLDMSVVHVPSGEAAKSLAVVRRLYQAMLDHSLSRDGLVLALGGGSVGDTVGFAAATYMRGVGYVGLPTTLLAQVDSAIGGKTAVDLDRHKNTVGAFHNPLAVVADMSTLTTLPQREMRSGLAEVLKYGLICDPELWHVALDWGGGLYARPGACPQMPVLGSTGEWVVRRCLEHKAAVVAADPLEQGSRELLNFGHTLGHALETAARGGLRHGEAVAAGMDFAAFLGERLRVTAPGTAAEVRRGLLHCGLWPALPRQLAVAELLKLMHKDKKARAGQCRFVLLTSPGVALPGPVAVPHADLARHLSTWLELAHDQRGRCARTKRS